MMSRLFKKTTNKTNILTGMNDQRIFIIEIETEREKVDRCVCFTGCYDFTFINSKNNFLSIKCN